MFPTINKKETGVNLRRIMDMRGVKPKDIQEYLGFGCVQSVYPKQLQIDKTFNDCDILTCPELWLEDDGQRFALGTDTRVGIGYAAPEDQARLWRWKCGAQEGCT